MHQGNWTCSGCGGEIKELPFEPRNTDGLTCRDCYFKKKDEAKAGTPAEGEVPEGGEAPAGSDAPPPSASDRPMFTGDWKCSGCGNAITELPFEPRNTENLKCRDCFIKEKNQ